MKPAVVILAAGRGVRMRSPVPKVLHPVMGRPMVSWVAAAAAELEPEKTVLVSGPFVEDLRAAAGEGIAYAIQEKPLGTAHAASIGLGALGGFDGDVVVLPGDTPLITGELLRSLLRAHESGGREATVLTFVPGEPGAYGRVLRGPGGAVTRIVEARDCSPEEAAVREVNSGMYCFKAGSLARGLASVRPENAQGEYYLTDVVAALPPGSVGAVRAEDPVLVMGINRAEELAQASAHLRARIVSEAMERGATVADPATAYIEHGVRIGEGTVIHPFVVIRKSVEIGRNCSIGPFAHLREGTVLCDGARVGDFVETKSCALGEGSAAGHLAYLGDAVIGKGVNVGAGVITANFDGKAKNLTEVGDGAFLGSGTVLVAPVRVGAGAVTGAGSVVTRGKDVLPGQTVAGVPARPMEKSSGAGGKRGKL